MVFIEVQTGELLDENDIIRYEDAYGRGIAQRLTETVVMQAEKKGKKIRPVCSYAVLLCGVRLKVVPVCQCTALLSSFILSLLLLCSPFFSRIERERSKSMSHISVRASRSFISYPNSSLDKRNEAASSFKILSSSALPGKSGIISICGAVMTGAIYFCSILLPCSPASKETSKI